MKRKGIQSLEDENTSKQHHITSNTTQYPTLSQNQHLPKISPLQQYPTNFESINGQLPSLLPCEKEDTTLKRKQNETSWEDRQLKMFYSIASELSMELKLLLGRLVIVQNFDLADLITNFISCGCSQNSTDAIFSEILGGLFNENGIILDTNSKFEDKLKFSGINGWIHLSKESSSFRTNNLHTQNEGTVNIHSNCEDSNYNSNNEIHNPMVFFVNQEDFCQSNDTQTIQDTTLMVDSSSNTIGSTSSQNYHSQDLARSEQRLNEKKHIGVPNELDQETQCIQHETDFSVFSDPVTTIFTPQSLATPVPGRLRTGMLNAEWDQLSHESPDSSSQSNNKPVSHSVQEVANKRCKHCQNVSDLFTRLANFIAYNERVTIPALQGTPELYHYHATFSLDRLFKTHPSLKTLIDSGKIAELKLHIVEPNEDLKNYVFFNWMNKFTETTIELFELALNDCDLNPLCFLLPKMLNLRILHIKCSLSRNGFHNANRIEMNDSDEHDGGSSTSSEGVVRGDNFSISGYNSRFDYLLKHISTMPSLKKVSLEFTGSAGSLGTYFDDVEYKSFRSFLEDNCCLMAEGSENDSNSNLFATVRPDFEIEVNDLTFKLPSDFHSIERLYPIRELLMSLTIQVDLGDRSLISVPFERLQAYTKLRSLTILIKELSPLSYDFSTDRQLKKLNHFTFTSTSYLKKLELSGYPLTSKFMSSIPNSVKYFMLRNPLLLDSNSNSYIIDESTSLMSFQLPTGLEYLKIEVTRDMAFPWFVISNSKTLLMLKVIALEINFNEFSDNFQISPRPVPNPFLQSLPISHLHKFSLKTEY
ncbi:unnamed protein product [Ambrosiozyma monospora]|uniref:Unnamed protein product n=1 Tax=Ambrosiozyma monospora TaxID=43982 RepID=A0A9W6YVH9_AMBMO|nr:unnamed protein product [Ambrosiozyma monospora]